MRMSTIFDRWQSNGMMVFMAAMSVSFLGSLPPGTTNILTVQLAGRDGSMTAFFFSCGCMLAEMGYVVLCLSMLDRLLRFERVLKLMQWISLAVLVVLAVASFLAAVHNKQATGITMATGKSPFVFGLILMIINPVQAPFWLVWTTVLMDKRILASRLGHYASYVAGAGAGSMLASIVFIFAGEYVFENTLVSQRLFHYLIGSFFLISAVFQAVNIFRGTSLRLREAD